MPGFFSGLEKKTGRSAITMKYFFFLSMGRSGTQFLASLLSKAPGTLVYHEPAEEDRVYFGLRYAGTFDKVMDAYLERRFQKLLKQTGKNYEVYGEVNSYLRYETEWLRKKFNPVFFHLVRDGRDFVRSAYTRGVYTLDDRKWMIVPGDQDPMAEKWENTDRFQKLCWYWKHTNEYIASRVERTVLFEKLLTDYDYFKDNVLGPLGLSIPHGTWSAAVKKPKNTSKRAILRKKIKRMILFQPKEKRIKPLPHWSQWDNKRKELFNEICFETMKKFGYL